MTTMTRTTMDTRMMETLGRKPRVFDVLLRRIEAAKGAADEAWEQWKANREDLAALHTYVRRVKRAARLKEAAVMDLAGRAVEEFPGAEVEGGAL
jgi:hypothetical protein